MVSHLHHRESGWTSAPQTRGFVWNWARRYDLLIGFVTVGREQAFRQRIADLAKLQPGENVWMWAVALERWRWSPGNVLAKWAACPASTLHRR